MIVFTDKYKEHVKVIYTKMVIHYILIISNNLKQRGEHGYSITRADNFVPIIIIEDNYSQLIQYVILKKLVTNII